jgi:hypothetical protein
MDDPMAAARRRHENGSRCFFGILHQAPKGRRPVPADPGGQLLASHYKRNRAGDSNPGEKRKEIV